MVTESLFNSVGLFAIIPIHASRFSSLNAVSRKLVEISFVILYTVVIFYSYCPNFRNHWKIFGTIPRFRNFFTHGGPYVFVVRQSG